MAISLTIRDGKGRGTIADVHDRHCNSGVVVFTEPLIERSFSNSFASNSCFGTNMAVDVTASGTPVGIHDGTDTCLWTGTIEAGNKITFASADRANVGCLSVKLDNMDGGSIAQFTTCCLLDLTCYATISTQVNIDKDWCSNDEIFVYGWCDTCSVQVGCQVELGVYLNIGDFDVWQSVTIPLEDMGLQTASIDSLRIEQGNKAGKGPKFYMDCIKFLETGDPIRFCITAPLEKLFSVDTLILTLTDNITGVVACGTMPGLSFNNVMGLTTLPNGMSLQFIRDNKVEESATYSDFGDFIREGFTITDTMSDGTNTLVAMRFEFVEPVRMSHRQEDRIRIVINDDMSGLDSFTALAVGRLENE